MEILRGVLTVVLVLFSIGLVTLVVMQTPKSEGFGGSVQNTPGSSFRGKAGYDDMLAAYTRYVAIGWFSTAFFLAIVGELIIKRG